MEAASNILFGVYFDEDSVPDERRYEEVPSVEVFLNLALASLDDYNSTRRSKMDITLFTFALQHLNRICRIISIQGASALIIGLGGSGRQSLTKLATNMVQTSFFQPEITKNYGANDWHDDIKAILSKWMFEKLNDCLKSNFKDKVENVFERYCVPVSTKSKGAKFAPLPTNSRVIYIST